MVRSFQLVLFVVTLFVNECYCTHKTCSVCKCYVNKAKSATSYKSDFEQCFGIETTNEEMWICSMCRRAVAEFRKAEKLSSTSKMSTLTTAGLLLVSLLYTNSVARITAVKFVCRNEPLTLPCATSDPHEQNVWQYSKSNGTNKQSLGYFSKKEAYLSTSIPPMFKEMTNISSDGALIISKFNSELNGIYSCSREEKYYRVQTLVNVVAVPCKTKVCQGDNAIVKCELLRHRDRLGSLQELVWKQGKTKIAVFRGPHLNFTWRNPKYQSIKVSEKVKGALSIESASQDVDGKMFTCTLHQLGGATPKRCSFTVEVLTHCENKKDACEGERVDLKCPYYQLLTTSTEDTRLEWYNKSRNKLLEDYGPMTESSLVKINKSAGVVTLLSPSVLDSGVYSCKILREKVVLAEHSVTLNVTQCTETSPSNTKNQNKERPADDTEKKDPAIKIIVITLLVIFILFISIGLLVSYCQKLSSTPI